jgi:hypothetical protein
MFTTRWRRGRVITRRRSNRCKEKYIVASDDRLKELEERYEGYAVYDRDGERIGKVDDLFVDEADREEYIGVKMGFFGLKSTLIPMDLVRVNERDRTMEVSESKDHVRDAPTFGDDDDITPEYEERVRRHFGLEGLETSTERGTYGRYSGATASGAVGATPATEGGMDTEGRMGHESYRGREDLGHSESATESADAVDATPSGGMRDLETGDRGRVEDEDYLEGYREGFREGLREGLREGGGRGEFGDRADLEPSGVGTGVGPVEEGTTRREVGEPRREGLPEGGPGDRPTGAAGPGEESRKTPRRSDEGEQQEGELTRVWRRIQR